MEVSAEPGLEVGQAAVGLAAAERGIEGSGEQVTHRSGPGGDSGDGLQGCR